MRRRSFLAAAATAGLSGCGLGNALNDGPLHGMLLGVEPLDHFAIGTHGMAKLYPESAIDRNFRVNGFDPPSDSRYTRLAGDAFASYRLIVDGLVEHPQALSLPEMRALASLTEITRHDCVEGWSAIGKWRGVPLATVLALAKPTPAARYVVFSCFDVSPDGDPYYESLGLHEAAHPQTVLALDLNDRPLDVAHGAPVRLRVPTQLGYKSAKWIRRITLAANLAGAGEGNGGYWEDQGYEWYAGI